MGTTYTGLKIKNTYGAIIKVGDNSNLTAFEKQLSDGLGNNTGLYVGTNNRLGIGISPTEALHVSGNIKSTATVVATTFSGDLNGTINTATTGVTQSAGDNSTKIATTAYCDSITTAQDLDYSDGSTSSSVDLDSQTFTIAGTSNEIETSASGQTLTIGLPSTIVVNVTGNVAGDLTGNVTATSVLANGVTATTQSASDNSTKIATTAFVQQELTGSDLDFSGTSGTGSVDLDSQTFAVIGTANEIETAASSQTLTIGLPNDVTIGNDLTVSNDLDVTGVITTAGVTEQATQFLFTKDLKVHDTIPVITLSDSDSSGASSTGDIIWIDSGATQKAIISLSSSNLGITSKAGALNFGTNSTNALTIDTSQDSVFQGTITTGGGSGSGGALTVWGGYAQNISQSGGTVTAWNLTNSATASGTSDTTQMQISQKDTGGSAIDLKIGQSADGKAFFGSKTVGIKITNASGNTEISGSLAIGGNATAIASWVTESQGIASNDNDTTIPTSAAVKDYVDSKAALTDTLSEVLAIGNTTGGTDIAVSANDDITFTDSSKAIFGAGSDLIIKHDGNNSKITEGGTGGLYIGSSLLGIESGDHSETMAKFTENAAVELYYDNSKKFETTSAGITVTGDSTFSGTVDITGAGNTLHLNASSGVTYQKFSENGTGRFFLATLNGSDGLAFVDADGSTQRMVIGSGGKVIVGTDSSNALEVFSSGDTEIGFSYASHGNVYAKIIGDITVASPLGGELAFQTATGGTLSERMRITVDGVLELTQSSGASGFLNTDGTNFEIDINRNPMTGAISDSAKGCARIQLRAEDGGAGSRIVFGTAAANNTTASERMRIDSSGNIEVKTTNGEINFTSGNGYVQTTTGSTSLVFGVNSSEKMRIHSSGKIGINTTAPDADLQIITSGSSDQNGVLKIGGSAASLGLVIDYDQSGSTVAKITSNPTYTNTGALMKICVDGDANADQLVLNGGGDIGIGTASASDYYADKFVVYDGDEGGMTIANSSTSGKSYLCFADGTSGAAAYAGYIAYDHNDNSMSFAGNGGNNRLTITSGGNVNIGSGGLTQVAYQLRVDSDFDNGIYLSAGTSSSNYAIYTENLDGSNELFLVRGDGNIKIPQIGVTTTATAIGVDGSGFIRKLSSSKRYKKDIEPIDIGLDFIDSLSPVKFKMKEDDAESVGLIAEDVIDNRFVTYSQIDMKDESKGLQVEGVNYQALIAPLIKSIQELKAEIETLKTQINK